MKQLLLIVLTVLLGPLFLRAQFFVQVDTIGYFSDTTLEACANSNLSFRINLSSSDTVEYRYNGILQGTITNTTDITWSNAFGAPGTSQTLTVSRLNNPSTITLTLSVYNALSGAQLRRINSTITSENVCNGGLLAANLQATATGGSANRSFFWQWSTDPNFAGTPSSTTTSTPNLSRITVGALTATTYFRATITDTDCGDQVITPVYTANVYAPLAATAVTQQGNPAVNTTAICYNDALPFSLTATASGGDNSYTYTWQRDDNTAFSSPQTIGTNSPILTSAQLGALTSTQYVRLRVTSGSSCGNVFSSNYFTVTVHPELQGGSATNAANGNSEVVCYNDPMQGNLTVNTSGGNPNTTDTHQWFRSANSNLSNPQAIAGATTTSLTPAQLGALTANTYVYAQVTDGTCGDVRNSQAYTFNVYNQLVATSLHQQTNSSITSENVCNGGLLAANLQATATGGSANRSFFWQWSTDPNFAGTPSSTTTSTPNLSRITVGALTATTYFRATITDTDCGDQVITPVYTANVYAPLAATAVTQQGNPAVNTTAICYNDALPFSLTATASGGDNSYTYTWQRDDNTAFSSPQTIGTNSPILTSAQLGALTSTQYVRLRVTSGSSCGNVFSSNYFTVTVHPELQGGSATNAANGNSEVVCYNDPMQGNLTVNTSGGNPNTTDTHQWFRSANSNLSNPQAIAGATSTSLTPAQLGALTDTTYVYAEVTDPNCNDQKSSATYTLFVYDQLTAGSVYESGNSSRIGDTLCYGGQLNYSLRVNHLGGNVSGAAYTYDWYVSTNSSLGNLVTTTNSAVLPAGSWTFNTSGQHFLRTEVRDACGDTALSQDYEIWVAEIFQPAQISTSSADSICYTTSFQLTRNQSPSGGLSGLDPSKYSVSYSWERSTDNGNTWQTVGADPLNLNQVQADLAPRGSYQYRLRTTDSCGSVLSNTLDKYVYARPYTDDQGTEKLLDLYSLDFELHDATGALALCDGQENVPIRLNQPDVYYDREFYSYSWSINGSSIVNQANEGQAVFAYISSVNGSNTQEISLQVTNDANGCERTVSENFTPSSNAAAEAVTILPKNSSSALLLAQLNGVPNQTVYVRWGQIAKEDGQLSYVSQWDTLRFFDYQSLDTSTYIYFAASSYEPWTPCRSFAYYPNRLNAIGTADEIAATKHLLVYPNPSEGQVNIQGLDPREVRSVKSYTMLGQELKVDYQDQPMLVHWLTPNIRGPVLLVIETETHVYRSRIILR